MTEKEVLNVLAIAYLEEILPLLPNLVSDPCSGCKNNIEYLRATTRLCLLPQKKRIELFTEMALLSIDASSVHSKVITRLKCRV